MSELKIDLRTCDLGFLINSPEAFVDLVIQQTLDSWAEGNHLVAWPEFSWLALEKFVSLRQGDESPLQRVSSLFWKGLWPDIVKRLTQEGKGVVLGSVPFLTPEGTLRNRVPMILGGRETFQDKLHLTPWESDFVSGETLHVFEWMGIRFSVIICMDIEIPEISVALRGQNLDLILVPSATESLLGVERIGRCASARSVELGCYVGVTHLVGRGESTLVDENVGRLAWLSPSQTPFAKEETASHREEVTSLMQNGFSNLIGNLEHEKLHRMRKRRMETNPSLVTAQIPRLTLTPMA